MLSLNRGMTAVIDCLRSDGRGPLHADAEPSDEVRVGMIAQAFSALIPSSISDSLPVVAEH